MEFRSYSSEEQLKLASDGWIGLLELEMFGVGMVGMAMFWHWKFWITIGNFGGNLTLECYLDIRMDTFEECPIRLFARTVYI
jgi:hypothetical protein